MFGFIVIFFPQIAFVKDQFVQVRVSAEVLDPHNGQVVTKQISDSILFGGLSYITCTVKPVH